MAPFSKASEAQYVLTREGKVTVYRGQADPLWTIGAVPHGGYVLALVVEACLRYQSSTPHRDPVHISAHFLRATSVGPFEVHVHTIRAGRSFSNLQADLIQDGLTRVTAHSVFGILDPSSGPPSEPALTLLPPSPLARLTPFQTHPSNSSPSPPNSRWNFGSYVRRTKDLLIRERHERLAETGNGTGGIETGGWYQLTDPADRLTPSTLALFADLFPDSLPWAANKNLPRSWYPTVVMSLEFKSPISRSSAVHSPQTVGVFMSSKFINDPQGRHDTYVEVWSAPGDIADGKRVKEGWREEQRCLLVSHQMGLVLPMEVNERKGRKLTEDTKSKL